MRNAFLEIQHYAVCMLCLAGKERARRSNLHDTSRFFQSRNKLKQCRATCISMQVFFNLNFFYFHREFTTHSFLGHWTALLKQRLCFWSRLKSCHSSKWKFHDNNKSWFSLSWLKDCLKHFLFFSLQFIIMIPGYIIINNHK